MLTNNPNTLITIIGGSGFIGQALAARLVKLRQGSGKGIRVVSRGLGKTNPLRVLPGIDIVQSPLSQEGDIADALSDSEVVINLVGILQSRTGKPWGPDFDEAHVKLPARIARVMQRAGMTRLIHVSALGASETAPSMYLRSKAAGELSLRRAGHLDLSILRPSVVFGPGDAFLNLFARMQSVLPVLPLVTPHARFQPIYIGDLITAITSCIDRPETAGKIYDCAGPDVLSLYEIAYWAGHYANCRRPILALPDGLAWLQAVIMERMPGRPLLSRDNLASASQPNVATGPMDPILGISQPIGLHTVAPHFLGQAQANRLLHRRSHHLARQTIDR
jgi:uncharacterized protein YbjT (DUF2867 family)